MAWRRCGGGGLPAGARGVDAETAGALVVTLRASVDLVASVVATVTAWLSRSPASGRSVELAVGDAAIRLTGASDKQQDQLIAEFIRSVDDRRRA